MNYLRITQADKQLRKNLFEYVVRANRLDRMKIPVVFALLKFGTAGMTEGTLPRVHIAVIRLGASPDGLVSDRWIFRGDDLHEAYNTTQVFSDSYPHGIHCLLSPWHLKGYALPEPVPIGLRLLRHLGIGVERPVRKPKPRHRVRN